MDDVVLCIAADYPSVKQQFSQQYQTPWDFPVPPADYAQAASLPMDFGQQPTSSPLFAAPEETIFSNTTATPAAAPALPKKLQHTSSSCSSDSKEDQEISKLQERIQKQKEKNARNQREFRRRVCALLAFAHELTLQPTLITLHLLMLFALGSA